MGIPLLHPWANRLGAWSYRAVERTVDLRPLKPLRADDGMNCPSTGCFPRAWRVLGHRGGLARLTAELDAGRGSPAHAAFPFPHLMRMDAEVRDATLRVRIATRRAHRRAGAGVLRLPSVPAARRFRAPSAGASGCPCPPSDAHRRAIPTGVHEPVEPYDGPLGDRRTTTASTGWRSPRSSRSRAAGGGSRSPTRRATRSRRCSPLPAAPISFEPMTAPANALIAGGFPVAEPGKPYRAIFSVTVH